MASNVNCTPEEAAIRELEEDLPSLACHAAIELDDIILGCEPRTEALGRLLSYLRNVMPRANQVLDPTTAVVMNRAIGDLPTGRRAATVDELVKVTTSISPARSISAAREMASLAGIVRYVATS
jgi:hypothetical protein